MDGIQNEADNESISESEDDDLQSSEVLAAKLKVLNERLETSRGQDYAAHEEKIYVLKAAGELDELRAARNEFSKHFPLSPKLWLDWIGDEKSIASTDDEKRMLHELFDRAVSDYVSVDLWLEYCQFAIGGAGGAEKTRYVFERAIAAVGLHVSKGALIWEAYREFEIALLGLHPNDDAQKERVDKLFCRQLAIPLLHMENTLSEYRDWLNGQQVSSDVEHKFKTAVNMLKAREPFEHMLMDIEDSDNADDERLTVYSDLIGFEVKNGANPARLQALYERRISELCLHPQVWLKYVEFLDHAIKIDTVVLPVYERAVRNIPTCGDIWVHYIRAIERYEQSKDQAVAVVERAMQNNFYPNVKSFLDIWLAYIDCLRRQIDFDNEDTQALSKDREMLRQTFGRAVEHLAAVEGDPECQVAKYWASVEAYRFDNMTEARKIWSDILALLGYEAKHWLEYIQLEKLYGDTKHLRKLFPKALEKTQDWPETVGEMWLQFEREEGSFVQFEECEQKFRIRMERAQEERMQTNILDSNPSTKKKSRQDKKIQKPEDVEVGIKKLNKRKVLVEDLTESSPAFKKPSLSIENSMIQPPPGYSNSVAPPPGFVDTPAAPPETSTDVDKETRTVFLSNLNFSTTEDRIRDVFSNSGTINEVRLVQNYAGKSKGFGYVEFSDVDEAKHALSRDRELLDGRPIFVSKCEKKVDGLSGGREHHFKFKTDLERNKLFLKGLPFSQTKEDLENIFGKFGRLRDVRLVTYRNGHSKGIAYVEFENDASASEALLKTDGMKIEDKEISVAISNPPVRKGDAAIKSERVKSLGGTTRETAQGGSRGRGRTQMAFMPRSVLPSTVKNGVSSKSNTDFRAMFLGEKK